MQNVGDHRNSTFEKYIYLLKNLYIILNKTVNIYFVGYPFIVLRICKGQKFNVISTMVL